jgi:hypothetical protein
MLCVFDSVWTVTHSGKPDIASEPACFTRYEQSETSHFRLWRTRNNGATFKTPKTLSIVIIMDGGENKISVQVEK